MTRAVCSILQILGTLRLCWQTIKLLNTNDASANATSSSSDASDRSSEIPKLWALLAFETCWRASVEVLFSWLPFYYYLKMIVLFVTLFVPKFPSYWFDCYLLQAIDKIHWALDFDWKRYFMDQVKYAPLILLDLLFLPGILGDDDAEDDRKGSADAVTSTESASSFMSPERSTTRSRIVASSLSLRKFSKEHGLTPSKISPRKKLVYETPAKAHANQSTNKRRRRRTMNEKLRRALCGDENIRVRDYLFDLDMPLAGGIGNDECTQRHVVTSVDRESKTAKQRRRTKNNSRRRTIGGVFGRSTDTNTSNTGKPDTEDEDESQPNGSISRKKKAESICTRVEQNGDELGGQGLTSIANNKSSKITLRRSQRVAGR